ncbi:uncharacterized protein LOC131901582 isoform X1 [Peromyscus eremicus]|uniref:uncharacterized protein LOC131901582 isoform X1 n=1 Tax=Peromyscus eremicus TaxID=42410 RepID=UPI0027DC5F26|nr:uncharacterized protein LOC131901582 isoform X1 [Peromyscus eremicus]
MFSCFTCFGCSRRQKPKLPGRFRRVLRSICAHLCLFSCRKNEDDRIQEDGPIFDPRSPTYMQDVINHIPKAYKDGNYLFIGIILTIYHRFVTTWEMLDLIMDTYGPLQPDCMEDQEKRNALLSFLSIWTSKQPQDFRSPNLAVAKRLVKYLWPDEPAKDFTLQGEALEEQDCKMGEEAWDDGLLREVNTEAPMQDALGMVETLHVGPTSVAEPREFLKTQDDTDLALGEPTVPEAGPVPLQTSDQPLPTDAQPPLEVAADVPDAGRLFLVSVVQLGAPEPFFPLPDVDID